VIDAGAGFLLAVLWFDFMFDVQVARHHEAVVPEDVVQSIAAYYRRVTTDARPMNRLVGLVMLGTIAAVVAAIVRGDGSAWVRWVSLPLVVVPVARAATNTFPSAARLGQGVGSPLERSRLARTIYRDHFGCLIAIATVLVVQLGFG
jgi:hypothetical protein